MRAEKLKSILYQTGHTVAVAESLTAGHVQAMISAVSGSSRYFNGGMTAYTLDAKNLLLGVDRTHAASVDCVSEQVAREMAVGVRDLFGSDIGVATTGYAEPDRRRGVDTPFAYLAISTPDIDWTGRVEVPGKKRTEVQHLVATAVLDQLLHMFEVREDGTFSLIRP